MTREEIMAANGETLETRLREIRAAIVANDAAADFDAMAAEIDVIEERRAQIVEEQRKEDTAAVIAGAGTKTEIKPQEDHTMTEMEIRNSSAYINAFANYIRTSDDRECRTLLTENVTGGTVPVPGFVYDIVKNAWESDEIMRRVKKSYLKGNLKVVFEISSTPAAVHTEGSAAPSEEALVLGVVDLTAASIKKWIRLTDELVDMGGEEFIRYIYDELTHRIAEAAADALISKIIACGTVSTNTPSVNVAVGVVSTSSIALGTIAAAMAELSAQAKDPVIIMNRKTWGGFKAVQASGNYGYDPFEGLPVLFNNSLKAFTAATTGDTFVIVGDLEEGAQANFPNGEDITIKYDDKSEAEADLVKIVGRQYVGLDVVGPNAFCKITKA